MTARRPLPVELAELLDDKPEGLPCDELALRVRRRRSAVLAALLSEQRFEHVGSTRGSRWRRRETARDGISGPRRPEVGT